VKARLSAEAAALSVTTTPVVPDAVPEADAVAPSASSEEAPAPAHSQPHPVLVQPPVLLTNDILGTSASSFSSSPGGSLLHTSPVGVRTVGIFVPSRSPPSHPPSPLSSAMPFTPTRSSPLAASPPATFGAARPYTQRMPVANATNLPAAAPTPLTPVASGSRLVATDEEAPVPTRGNPAAGARASAHAPPNRYQTTPAPARPTAEANTPSPVLAISAVDAPPPPPPAPKAPKGQSWSAVARRGLAKETSSAAPVHPTAPAGTVTVTSACPAPGTYEQTPSTEPVTAPRMASAGATASAVPAVLAAEVACAGEPFAAAGATAKKPAPPVPPPPQVESASPAGATTLPAPVPAGDAIQAGGADNSSSSVTVPTGAAANPAAGPRTSDDDAAASTWLTVPRRKGRIPPKDACRSIGATAMPTGAGNAGGTEEATQFGMDEELAGAAASLISGAVPAEGASATGGADSAPPTSTPVRHVAFNDPSPPVAAMSALSASLRAAGIGSSAKVSGARNLGAGAANSDSVGSPTAPLAGSIFGALADVDDVDESALFFAVGGMRQGTTAIHGVDEVDAGAGDDGAPAGRGRAQSGSKRRNRDGERVITLRHTVSTAAPTDTAGMAAEEETVAAAGAAAGGTSPGCAAETAASEPLGTEAVHAPVLATSAGISLEVGRPSPTSSGSPPVASASSDDDDHDADDGASSSSTGGANGGGAVDEDGVSRPHLQALRLRNRAEAGIEISWAASPKDHPSPPPTTAPPLKASPLAASGEEGRHSEVHTGDGSEDCSSQYQEFDEAMVNRLVIVTPKTTRGRPCCCAPTLDTSTHIHMHARHAKRATWL